ncbi:MAG: Maf family protein [Bacteroidia bacterium]
MHPLNVKILLASRSPRRKEILEKAGFRFRCVPAGIDETHPAEMPAKAIPEYLAKQKAEALTNQVQPGEVILAADTIVILDNEILEKPADAAEAMQMLRKLSGKMHTVITGVCLKTQQQTITFSDLSEVYFKHLEKEEIDWYVNQYKPFDKAGAYGVQEFIGMIGIEKMVGSYFNVMGLPVHKVYAALKKM